MSDRFLYSVAIEQECLSSEFWGEEASLQDLDIVEDELRLPSGYDDDFINPVDDDLQCSICLLPLREPVLTRCGHRFCRECLEQHWKRQKSQNQEYNCPVDREELVPNKDIFPDKATERKVHSLVVKCSSTGCDWTGELRDKEPHLISCPLKLVSCFNANCEVTTARKDLEVHMTTTCQWRVEACEHCNELHPNCLLQDHVNNCQKKPIACPNSCGEFVVREEIECHVDSRCPLTIISCPYAQMGCNAKIPRKEVESHLQCETRDHIDQICATFKETTGKLEQRLGTLEKQVQELTAANAALGSKVYSQEQTISRLKTENESTTFVWRVDDFSEVLEAAMDGSNEAIYSPPFYSGKQGYKLKACMFPDGDQSNRNRYMSLSIRIMKGTFDALLAWPFEKKVTFTLIDQYDDPSKRKNWVDHFTTDTTCWSCRRPSSDWEENQDMDGIARFVSHKNLMTRRYIVDDTLFLQVNIDSLFGSPSDFDDEYDLVANYS